ncbi:glycosyltransferase family 4 protein [candidate division FCPU426 bacterium]|nr:glycosyltransferase family 4 protein [candidate division FCPU426 bacterium]
MASSNRQADSRIIAGRSGNKAGGQALPIHPAVSGTGRKGARMKILVVSHSAVVPLYREKFHILASMGCEVHLLLPPSWPEGGRNIAAPPTGKEGEIHIHRLAGRFLGKVGGFHFKRLARVLHHIRPGVVQVEEEPYSLAAGQILWASRRRGLPFVFFTWENILRTYKPPLHWIDRWVLHHAQWAIAGTQAAQAVLAKRGFKGTCAVIPQYGVNPAIFRPYDVLHAVKPTFTIGFFGRLCEEKGIMTLLRATEELAFPWRLHITGNGPLQPVLQKRVREAGLEKQVLFMPAVDNDKMPKAMQTLDLVVLPSESTPAWKEQFGRVLIEAMACEIPVIGSDCGEIPTVIGEGGLTFAEKDWKSLAAAISLIQRDHRLAAGLGQKGRRRVLEHYTTRHIARQTWELYQRMLERKQACSLP